MIEMQIPSNSKVVKLSGSALKLIGSIFNRTHIYFLGHYLEGSGKNLKLPEKFFPIILEDFKESLSKMCGEEFFWETSNDTLVSLYESSLNEQEYDDSDELNFRGFGKIKYVDFLVMRPYGRKKATHQLYHSIGKFKVIPGQGYLFIEDKYEFYSWCEKQTHFSDCQCSYRWWSGINPKINFSFRFSEIIQRIVKDEIELKFRINKVNLTIYLSKHEFGVNVSDKLFSFFGKPFYVFAKIPYDYKK